MNDTTLEGDFLETYDGLICDVKGELHPADRIIAYLRYIPISFFDLGLDTTILPKSSKKIRILRRNLEKKLGTSIEDIRFRRGTPYIKVYDITSRMKILSEIKPSYIYKSKNYDFSLQAVPIQDIKKIHKPEYHLREKLNLCQDKILDNLIHYLQNIAEIPLSALGLSGSDLVDLSGYKSDYDLIIYGKEEGIKTYSALKEIIASKTPISYQTSQISIYKGRWLRKLYKFRAKGFPIQFRDFQRIEMNKTHQFLIDGRDVFIRYVPHQRANACLPRFEDFKFQNLGRTSVIADIREDSLAFFTPGRYVVFIDKIISGPVEMTKSEIEVFTLRGRFLEQAKIGDLVKISGKLEQVHSLKTNTYNLRIVLGTHPEDIMIQIKRSKSKLS